MFYLLPIKSTEILFVWILFVLANFQDIFLPEFTYDISVAHKFYECDDYFEYT